MSDSHKNDATRENATLMAFQDKESRTPGSKPETTAQNPTGSQGTEESQSRAAAQDSKASPTEADQPRVRLFPPREATNVEHGPLPRFTLTKPVDSNCGLLRNEWSDETEAVDSFLGALPGLIEDGWSVIDRNNAATQLLTANFVEVRSPDSPLGPETETALAEQATVIDDLAGETLGRNAGLLLTDEPDDELLVEHGLTVITDPIAIYENKHGDQIKIYLKPSQVIAKGTTATFSPREALTWATNADHLTLVDGDTETIQELTANELPIEPDRQATDSDPVLELPSDWRQTADDQYREHGAESLVIEHNSGIVAELYRDTHSQLLSGGGIGWDAEYIEPDAPSIRRDGVNRPHEDVQDTFESLAGHITERRAKQRERHAQQREMDAVDWPEKIGRYRLRPHNSPRKAVYETQYLHSIGFHGVKMKPDTLKIQFFDDTCKYYIGDDHTSRRKQTAIDTAYELLEKRTHHYDEYEQGIVENEDIPSHRVPTAFDVDGSFARPEIGYDAPAAGEIRVGNQHLDVPESWGRWDGPYLSSEYDTDPTLATYLSPDRQVALQIEGTTVSNKWRMTALQYEQPLTGDPEEASHQTLKYGPTDDAPAETRRLTHGNLVNEAAGRILKDHALTASEVRQTLTD